MYHVIAVYADIGLDAVVLQYVRNDIGQVLRSNALFPISQIYDPLSYFS